MSETKSIGHSVYPPTIKRSIWGTVQYQHNYAEGIDFVSTAGHGGFKLDRKRNAKIPKAFRMEGGWYEEDVNFNIVIYFFADTNEDWTEKKDKAERQLKIWLWQNWEVYTGKELQPGESHFKDEHVWKQANKDKFIVRSALLADDRNWVNVTAVRESDGARGEWTVPTEEYRTDKNYGNFVIDEARHLPKI